VIILDTNVVSELMRPARSEAVLRWLAEQPRAALHITALTCAEILVGLSAMSPGRRRRDLAMVAEGLFIEDFGGRILSFDFPAAEAFARIVAARSAAGRPIGTVDAMIAAVAQGNGATIATRDAGFAGCGVPLINPWMAG
jgi:predicted nucleic acid-binding protein